MSAKILFECQNLTLARGTGIATYARNLARDARALGHVPSALFGSDRPFPSAGDTLDEITLTDATPAYRPFPLREAQDLYRAHWGDRKPLVARKVARNGLVATPGSLPREDAFADLYAVHDLTERARRLFKHRGQLLAVENTGAFNLFHSTQIVPIEVPGIPNLCTIHDIIPLRLPNVTLDNKGYFADVVKAIARRMDLIITVSDYSKADILKFTGLPEDKVVNTYQSVSLPEEILALSDAEVAEDIEAAHGLAPRGYYLFFGAIEPKKNVSRLIEAYAASGAKRPLLLCGHFGWQFEEDRKRIESERFLSWRIKDNEIRPYRSVRHLDYVPRASLLRLIRGARAVVFPSLYEGFGLPVLEAMLLGTPVITSNLTSLPEIAGDAALLVDPYDENAIAKAIRTLDNDDALCATLGERGKARAALFSPEAVRARLRQAYDRVL